MRRVRYKKKVKQQARNYKISGEINEQNIERCILRIMKGHKYSTKVQLREHVAKDLKIQKKDIKIYKGIINRLVATHWKQFNGSNDTNKSVETEREHTKKRLSDLPKDINIIILKWLHPKFIFATVTIICKL